MKLNTDKCLLLASATKYEHSWGKIGDNKIWEGNEVKLLNIIIDNKLKSYSHIANICSKPNQCKLSAKCIKKIGEFVKFR